MFGPGDGTPIDQRRRCALLAAGAFLVFGGTAWAEEAPLGPSDRAAIQGVISRQLDAFKRDDAPEAYRWAAPNVQAIFPTPERFIEMVKRGYKPVYRPRTVEFSELAVRDGAIVQEVELVGPDGQPALAVYTMVRDGAGGWLIAACQLMPSVRVGV